MDGSPPLSDTLHLSLERGLLACGVDVPGVKEGEVFEGDGALAGGPVVLPAVGVEAVKEQPHVAVPPHLVARPLELRQRDEAAAVLVQGLVAELDGAEGRLGPGLEGLQELRARGVVFPHADRARHVLIQHTPGPTDVPVEGELPAGLFELDPRDLVRAVPVQQHAPRTQRVPVCPEQQVPQLPPGLGVGLRVEPLGRLPLVEPLQVRAHDQPAAVGVQRRHQHRPRGGVRAARPVQGPKRLGKVPEEHLLLRGPGAALLAPARGAGLGAVPDGGAGAQQAVGPVLELCEDRCRPRRELLKGGARVPVLVQRPPEVHGFQPQLGPAQVATQRRLRDAEGRLPVQLAPHGADLAAVALPQVLQKGGLSLRRAPVGVEAPVAAALARDDWQLLEDIGLPGPRREPVLSRGRRRLRGGVDPGPLDVLEGDLLLPLPHEPHLRVEEPVRAERGVELQEHDVILDDAADVPVVAAIVQGVELGGGGVEAARCTARRELAPRHLSLPGHVEGLEHLGGPVEAVLDPALEAFAQLPVVGRQLREGQGAEVVVRAEEQVRVAGPREARGGAAEVWEVHLEEAVGIQLQPPAAEDAAVALLGQDVHELQRVLLPVGRPRDGLSRHLVSAGPEERMPAGLRHRRQVRRGGTGGCLQGGR
mmetsp:Transcript_64075/g.198375  ORF Transcript_64075/g.198375 Transcript_64075/m.198375 type:complete len:649 (+) Transcript_64075:243-2189(+)